MKALEVLLIAAILATIIVMATGCAQRSDGMDDLWVGVKKVEQK